MVEMHLEYLSLGKLQRNRVELERSFPFFRISKLFFSGSNNIQGTIPTDVGLMSELRFLVLGKPFFRHDIIHFINFEILCDIPDCWSTLFLQNQGKMHLRGKFLASAC